MIDPAIKSARLLAESTDPAKRVESTIPPKSNLNDILNN
jgi:hypothetical protein